MAKNNNQSAALSFLSAFADETKTRQGTLPVSEIVLHDNNTAAQHDTTDAIRELADSIETNGLIHPLAVNQTADHKYRLISGERRYRAITECLHWAEVPCTIYSDLTPAMECLVLVTANLQAREYSAADKLELYLQSEKALKEMKAAGQYKGGIQKGIAEMLNVSDRQIRKYKAAVEAVGETQLHAVKTISPPLPKKAELSSAFQEDEETLLYILQCIYTTAEVESYYNKHLPTPAEAVLLLRPENGYQGGAGMSLPDGRSWSYERTRKEIIVNIEREKTTLRYLEVDRIIRKAIRGGSWRQQDEPITVTSTATSLNQWEKISKEKQAATDQIINSSVSKDLPSKQRGSAHKPCVIDFSTLSPISDELHNLKMEISADGRAFLTPRDYDKTMIAIDFIRRDLRQLRQTVTATTISITPVREEEDENY